MELIAQFIDIFLHLDKHLDLLIRDYGTWSYLILFTIVFCETGLVVTPFLPGDSLLFAAGTFAGLGSFQIAILFFLLWIAAVLGDTVNYWVGHKLGPKVLQQENSRIFKKQYLDKTHRFFEKYGGKTIVIARFVPIVRTFAPFLAGVGSMTYGRFLAYNVFGGLAWVAFFVFGGYFFGNLDIVRRNFSLLIIAIILISVMPMVIEYFKMRREEAATKIAKDL
jgi:membrane-associated protein